MIGLNVLREPTGLVEGSKGLNSEGLRAVGIPVLVYGFEEEDLKEWPEDLRGVPVLRFEHLPESPVVVHRRAFEVFQKEALQLGAQFGRMPWAILYLPPGEESPPEVWSYVDAVVTAGDWERLRRLLQCPRRFESMEWVEEIPMNRLFALSEPPTAEEILELPLPTELREHIAQCEACQEAFTEALEARRGMARMFCPSSASLRIYLQEGGRTLWIQRHLTICPLCRSEAEVLFFTLSLPAATLSQIVKDPEQPEFLREWAIRRLRELEGGGAAHEGRT